MVRRKRADPSGKLTQPPDIPKHPQAVVQDMDFAGGGVMPFDGKIGHSVTAFTGEEKDFDVEGEAIDGLRGKEIVHDVFPKGFKAALRVAQRNTGNEAHHAVESLAHAAAQPILIDHDVASSVLPVPDQNGDVGSLGEFSEEGVHGRERHAEVGVHKENYVALRGKHTLFNGVAFAALLVVGKDAAGRITFSKGARDDQGGVGAGLNDEEDFSFFSL